MPRKQQPQRGGTREGAGRPGLFTGTREKVTVKITELARRQVAAERVRLKKRHGTLATESAAIESLIRKATRTRMDL